MFLTRDDTLIRTLSDAIENVTGRRPALSTSGGTSDARFIKNYCPVVEFGPVGTSMHQIDEHVPLAEIEQTAAIYEEFIDAYFRAMNGPSYIRENLAGAWKVMLGRAEGLNRLDASLEGFWRSFAAVALIAPFALIILISQRSCRSPQEMPSIALTGGVIAGEGLVLLVDWFTFPLIFALLAGPFGLGPLRSLHRDAQLGGGHHRRERCRRARSSPHRASCPRAGAVRDARRARSGAALLLRDRAHGARRLGRRWRCRSSRSISFSAL